MRDSFLLSIASSCKYSQRNLDSLRVKRFSNFLYGLTGLNLHRRTGREDVFSSVSTSVHGAEVMGGQCSCFLFHDAAFAAFLTEIVLK